MSRLIIFLVTSFIVLAPANSHAQTKEKKERGPKARINLLFLDSHMNAKGLSYMELTPFGTFRVPEDFELKHEEQIRSWLKSEGKRIRLIINLSDEKKTSAKVLADSLSFLVNSLPPDQDIEIFVRMNRHLIRKKQEK